jgi:tetratricopeptide (TPR) repeat protein
MALAPELDARNAERECFALSELSIINIISNRQAVPENAPHVYDPREDSLVIHGGARRHLFNNWLRKENHEAFAIASARLVQYYRARVSHEARPASTDESELRGITPRNSAVVGNLRRREPDTLRDERIKTELMFHRIGADQEKGFAEFEELCHQRRSQLRFNDCEYLINLVHEYDGVLKPDARYRLRFQEAELALNRRQLASADSLLHSILFSTPPPSIELQIEVWIRIGGIEAEKRRWKEAIHSYNNALSMVDWLEDSEARRSFIVSIFRDLGVACRDSGDLRRAEKFLRKSICYSEEMGSLEDLAQGHNSFGTLCRKLGNMNEAIDEYKSSLSFLRQMNDRFRPAQIYNNIGLTYLDQRCWDDSLHFFEKSLRIKRREGDTIGQARTLNNLMQAYSNLGRHEDAVQTAEHAVKLFEEVQDYYGAAIVNRNLGRLYRRAKGKIGRMTARRFYEQAVELMKKTVEERQFERKIGMKFDDEFVGKNQALTLETRLLSEVQAINEEIKSLSLRFWLPWWMWVSIVALLLFVVWFFAPLVPSIFNHSPF